MPASHNDSALLTIMGSNCTLWTSLGTIGRDTLSVTTISHPNAATDLSAPATHTVHIPTTSFLAVTMSATPIPMAARLGERVQKIAVDSNRISISPSSALGLLVVLFVTISAWYLVVRFMFLTALRPTFGHFVTNANDSTRSIIQSSYDVLGSSGRMMTQVIVVLTFFAFEQWLFVDTILEATAGEALKHHPAIDIILRVFGFFCQVLCWFMVGELKKTRAAKNSKVRHARQKVAEGADA